MAAQFPRVDRDAVREKGADGVYLACGARGAERQCSVGKQRGHGVRVKNGREEVRKEVGGAQ